MHMQIKFRQFIPSILNVARQCLSSGDEDVAIIAFEIFDELIESPAPLLGDSVKSIVQFSLEVCSSQNLEPSTRHQVRYVHQIMCPWTFKILLRFVVETQLHLYLVFFQSSPHFPYRLHIRLFR